MAAFFIVREGRKDGGNQQWLQKNEKVAGGQGRSS
jgi:hypothetical protein